MLPIAVLVGLLLLIVMTLLYAFLRGERVAAAERDVLVTPPAPPPAPRRTQVAAIPQPTSAPPPLPQPSPDRSAEPSWIEAADSAFGRGRPIDALLRVCLRRGELLSIGHDQNAVFAAMDAEITEQLLSPNPASEEAVEHLRTLIRQLETAAALWVDSPGETNAVRPNALDALSNLLAGVGAGCDAPSPLREYRVVVDVCSPGRAMTDILRTTTQYLTASSGTTDRLPRQYAAFRTLIAGYAQKISGPLGQYNDQKPKAQRLGQITTLLTFITDFRQVSLAETKLPRFEAQLSACLLHETRAVFMSEYGVVRGRPSWKVLLTDGADLNIGGTVAPQLHLALVDDHNMRPKHVTVSDPRDDGLQCEYVLLGRRSREDLRPQNTPQMKLDVGITITQPPHTRFPLTVQLPIHVQWEDHGIIDDIYLSPEFELTCSVRRPASNPYTDGHGGLALDGDSSLFTGRQDIVGDILQNLRRPASTTFFVVWGLSRSGKTSVINRIRHLMKDEAIVVSTSGQLEGSLPGRYPRELKSAIHHALDVHNIHVSERIQQKARDTKPRPVEEFFYFLNEIELLLREHNRMLLVTLDEYDRLQLEEALGTDDGTIKMLKTIFDRPDYARIVRFIAAGTFSLSQLEDHNRAWREALGGRLVHKRLDLFPFEDARDLIVTHSAKVNVSWPAPMVECVYSLTGGHPFLTNLLCFWVIEEAYEKGRSLTVDTPLIEDALEAWLREAGGGISDLKFCYDEPTSWTNSHTQLIQHTLSKLAAEDNASPLEPLPAFTKGAMADYLRRHYPTVPLADIDLDRPLRDLEKREVLRSVEQSDGRAYSIRFGMLDYALRRSGGLFDNLLHEAGYD